MIVLVVGASGPNAGMVMDELSGLGVTVRGMVRDEAKVEQVRRRGAAETVVADLRDPASLRRAVDGADGVFHLNPAFAENEADMGVAMVQAAAGAGVRKFVFSSVYHPSISALVNHAGKRPVEEALYGSELDFTILQPAMFMQTVGASWESIVRTGRIALPYSAAATMSYVDYRDVAEIAARSFVDDRFSYGTFELAAGGMVSRIELAALVERVIGRPVTAATPGFDDWAATAGISAGPLRDGLERMNAHYDEHGFHGGNALVLRSMLGREPRTLHDYIAELAAG